MSGESGESESKARSREVIIVAAATTVAVFLPYIVAAHKIMERVICKASCCPCDPKTHTKDASFLPCILVSRLGLACFLHTGGSVSLTVRISPLPGYWPIPKVVYGGGGEIKLLIIFKFSTTKLLLFTKSSSQNFLFPSLVAEGPYDEVVKLQTMRCFFEAYEHVLCLLENVFTPMFCHSSEVILNTGNFCRFVQMDFMHKWQPKCFKTE